MKRFIIIVVSLALFLAIMPKGTYQIQGTITNKNEITDSTGYIWEYDTDDFRVGDKVVITFQERGTTSRVDDIIKGIK